MEDPAVLDTSCFHPHSCFTWQACGPLYPSCAHCGTAICGAKCMVHAMKARPLPGYLTFFCFAIPCLAAVSSWGRADGSHFSSLLLYQGQSGTQATIANATPPPYTCTCLLALSMY